MTTNSDVERLFQRHIQYKLLLTSLKKLLKKDQELIKLFHDQYLKESEQIKKYFLMNPHIKYDDKLAKIQCRHSTQIKEKSVKVDLKVAINLFERALKQKNKTQMMEMVKNSLAASLTSDPNEVDQEKKELALIKISMKKHVQECQQLQDQLTLSNWKSMLHKLLQEGRNDDQLKLLKGHDEKNEIEQDNGENSWEEEEEKKDNRTRERIDEQKESANDHHINKIANLHEEKDNAESEQDQ